MRGMTKIGEWVSLQVQGNSAVRFGQDCWPSVPITETLDGKGGPAWAGGIG